MEEDDVKPERYQDLTIAVIDDDGLITRLVERLLERMGIGHVFRITHPMRFLDMVAEGLKGVHLVICDINMPDVDGHEVLRVVRNTHPDMPFIMLTGDQTGEAVKKAIEGGVSAYIVKPIDGPKLTQKVASMIERAYGIRA